MSRIVKVFAVIAMLLVALAGASGGQAHAQGVPAQTVHAQAVPVHDMSHPEKANYPCLGDSHSGIVTNGVMPVFHCDKQGKNVPPAASNPSTSCVNGIVYLQGFTGVPGYSSTTVVKTFYNSAPYAQLPSATPGGNWYDGGGIEVWVQYFWCPAVNSTQYPNGINWAYGRIYDQLSSSCIYVETGYDSRNGGYYNGANLFYGSNGQSVISNGEGLKPWTICPGSSNYVYDYSLPGNGSNVYLADMQTEYQNLSAFSFVVTPKFQ